MKFIKPSEISSKIMTLLDESDKFVVIVSPYVKISKWFKLIKKIDNLKDRHIPFKFIIRDDKTNQTSFDEMTELELPFKAIPDLHCKLYLNEKYAIVSSMNLLLSSEINSIELAYQTETESEYNELIEFCKRYLNFEFTSNNLNKLPEIALNELIIDSLKNGLNEYVKIKPKGAGITISTQKNTYDVFICNERRNYLRLSGILSGKEFDLLKCNANYMPFIEGLKLELIKGNKNYYNTIVGSSEISFQSRDLSSLQEKEKSIVLKLITEFVFQTEKAKNIENLVIDDIIKDLQEEEKTWDELWKKRVQSLIKDKKVHYHSGKLVIANFPVENATLETQNGISTIVFSDNLNHKSLFEKYGEEINKTFRNYRIFWNPPFNKLHLYGAKSKKFSDLIEEINYYDDGLVNLTKFIQNILKK